MKTRAMVWASLLGLALTSGLASCGDDNPWSWQNEGSKVEMSRDRAFIVNEGSYDKNNANLGYFNFGDDKAYEGDLYEAQNGRKIGDTAQDLISHDGNLYLVAAGSKYVARLDGVGKEQARVSFADNAELGDPRYVAASGDYLYVTSYGGFVNRIDAHSLEMRGSVKVGSNPEQIVVSDGKIYCVNSGWGLGNTLSVIDEAAFDEAENVTIMPNPQRLIAVGDKLIIQGTGADYYTPRVDVYDKQTKQSVKIGEGSSMAASGNMVYVANTTSRFEDGAYVYSTSFYAYNVLTGEVAGNPFKNAPVELSTSISYGVSVNPYTGHIYVCTTRYNMGDGAVYHFDAGGNYVGKVPSYGQNPSKVVFMY